MTAYIVFESKDGDWREVGRVNATGTRSAIRTLLANPDAPGSQGSFVAVPARSWQPVKAMSKVQTTLVIEAAKS